MLTTPASQGSECNTSLWSCLDFPAHGSMAKLQLIWCMSLHAMAFSVLSSFPTCSREKKSPFILQCRQLKTPWGHKAAAAAGGLHSPAPHLSQPCPQPNNAEHFGKTKLAPNYTRQSWGDPSAPNGTFHPSHDEPAPFPAQDPMGVIFPFTTVMKLQSKRDRSEKQKSFYSSLFYFI